MQKRARTDFRLFRGWTGGLLLHPWLDWLAVRGVANWYLPLSRAWAAGVAVQGAVPAFAESLGIDPALLPKAEKVLARLEHRRRLSSEANEHWEKAFFGPVDPGPEALAAAEAARFKRSTTFMATRGAFLPVRRNVRRVDWRIAAASRVLAEQGHRLAAPSTAFPAPDETTIDFSRTIVRNGRIEGWLWMTSPVLGDMAWARVFRPASGPVHGTVVSLHGVFMEQDSWGMADPVTDLVKEGFCVIRPEGPWHGRRCPPGCYGGEMVFAEGILGFVEVFQAWVAEVALFVRWARQEIGPRVAVAGISLGALTSQLVVSACGSWPQDMRPDAALLITTTNDIVDGALNGSLAREIRILENLWMAGWTRDEMQRWQPLVEPRDEPAIDPRRIVMSLGDADTITPYASAREFAGRWRIPEENLFVRHRGHFTTALGLYHNPAPLHRLATIMKALNKGGPVNVQ